MAYPETAEICEIFVVFEFFAPNFFQIPLNKR
jgi:hypothetical protein